MTAALDVYFGETLAGHLTRDDNGLLGFTYARSYLDRRAAQAISVAMPLREEPYPDRIARPYFSGLLPDERARARLASALGISEGNAFGLLEVIGGECAGALSLFPAGTLPPAPANAALRPLTSGELAALIARLRTRPLLAGEDGIRLSLAGAQDKLAVCVTDGTIALPAGGNPTTHILKPFIEALEGTVENELFCMRLAALLGLAAPAVGHGRAEGVSYILVERYDRRQETDGTITRLHQEDFCQALSVPPELKYEEEGGPGLDASLALIQRATARPAAGRLEFLRRAIFNYLVGNADAHAKNHALLYTGAVPDLAPAYDILCTAAYPNLSKKLAMAIGGRNVPDTIHLKHWLAHTPATRPAQRQFTRMLGEMATAIRMEAASLSTDLEAEGVSAPILQPILKTIEIRSAHVLRIAYGQHGNAP